MELFNLLVIVVAILLISYLISCMFYKKESKMGYHRLMCPCCRRWMRNRCMPRCCPRRACLLSENFEGGRGSEYESNEGKEVEEIPRNSE